MSNEVSIVSQQSLVSVELLQADDLDQDLEFFFKVPLHIGLPSSPTAVDDPMMMENSFDDNVSNISSTPSYDPSHNTSTLPATQRTTID